MTITDPINLDHVLRKQKQQEFIEQLADLEHLNEIKIPAINLSSAPPKVVVIMSRLKIHYLVSKLCNFKKTALNRVHASDAPSSFMIQVI